MITIMFAKIHIYINTVKLWLLESCCHCYQENKVKYKCNQ